MRLFQSRWMGEPRRAVTPAKPQVPKYAPPEAPPLEPGSEKVTAPTANEGHAKERTTKSHFWRDAGWVAVIIAIIALFASIFNKELHDGLLESWQRLTSLP